MAVGVWPALVYDDAPAALEFLMSAFGFAEGVVVRTDSGDIAHAELVWPHGGGVMMGSTKSGPSAPWMPAPGNGSVYVVSPDVDALFSRATAAGAVVVKPLTDRDFGSRDFTVRDPEGNLWAFGTYAGTEAG